MMRIKNSFSNPYTPNFQGRIESSDYRGETAKLKEIEKAYVEKTKGDDSVVKFYNYNKYSNTPQVEKMYCGNEKCSHGISVRFNDKYTFNDFFNEPKEVVLKTLDFFVNAGKQCIKTSDITQEYIDKMQKHLDSENLLDYFDNLVFVNAGKLDFEKIHKDAQKDEDIKNIFNKITIE